MRIIKEDFGFEEVREVFSLNHKIGDSRENQSNEWALETLIMANDIAKSWSLVELAPEEILKVFLPWHVFDCDPEKPLVPQYTKMTVGQAAQKIKGDSSFATHSPDCAWRMDHWKSQNNIPAIFLFTQPLLEREDYEAYADLSGKKGNLFHLDGFHRMVGSSLNEDFSGTIQAYIAHGGEELKMI